MPAQAPKPSHWSAAVSASPSSHVVPCGSGSASQASAPESQMPTLHWSSNEVQSGSASPATHEPKPSHSSPSLQNAPSSQLEPAGASATAQVSSVSSQLATSHSTAKDEQSRAVPAQAPRPSHDSFTVQNRPSSQ